jgi:hypothetical protein
MLLLMCEFQPQQQLTMLDFSCSALALPHVYCTKFPSEKAYLISLTADLENSILTSQRLGISIVNHQPAGSAFTVNQDR